MKWLAFTLTFTAGVTVTVLAHRYAPAVLWWLFGNGKA